MKILIIGCGKVGYYVAERMIAENHNVTLIDTDENAVSRANETLDALAVSGNGTSVTILREARVEDSDVVIALTGSDEVNMLACYLAKNLGAKHTIARIRNVGYLQDIASLRSMLDLDMTINPEQATANAITRLVRFPQAAEIETFYRGRLEMVSFRVWEGDFISGCEIASIKRYIHDIPILFAAVERNGSTFIPDGSFVFQPEDKVHVLGEISGVSAFFRALGRAYTRTKNAIIIGGGRITYHLSRELDKIKINNKIIEIDPNRARELSNLLNHDVICGDGTDHNLLSSESLRNADVFISLTGRDEDNMMTGLYALQKGVQKVIVKSTRQNYGAVAAKLGIDGVVSPKAVTANHIIRFVRGLMSSKGQEMLTLYQIADHSAEAMEFSVTTADPKFCSIPLRNLQILDNTRIGAILRKNQIIIPGGNDTIEEGDNVIVISIGGMVRSLGNIFE